MKKNIHQIAALLLAGLNITLTAQVNVTADSTTVVELNGPRSVTEFYAQFNNVNFDEYSLAEYALSTASFGGQNVISVDSLTLRLTVNDRTFSETGPFDILFTTDSEADLTTTDPYDALAFDVGQTYGIDSSSFSYAPVVVGTGTYDETVAPGGATIDVPIDLTTIGSDILAAISSGESFHLLIGIQNSESTVATFSGVGNTFDPGDPTLIIEATTDGPAPEPAAYPTDFSANATFRDITLTWTDIQDPVSYYVVISENSNITPPTDGTPATEDLDLGDGVGAAVAAAGDEAFGFVGLDVDKTYYFAIFPFTNSGVETDYKTDAGFPTASASTSAVPAGQILITQYYEGPGTNKYIELTNITGSPIDLSSFILTAWSNAATENWKTPGNTTERTTTFDGITLAPGATIVVADPNATSPIASGDADVSNGGSTFFNGDDSVVLYASSAQDPSNIVDAIPFTDDGNEGVNNSFVRTSTDQGYDLVAGTSVLDFPAVWSEITLATADDAVVGDDAFLGSSGLVTPTPQLSFTTSSITVNEGVGMVDLIVQIQNPDGSPVSADIVFDAGDGLADLDDIGNYTTQTINFGAGAVSGDQETVTITITDDSLEEPTEDAVFRLENLTTSGDAILGSPITTTVRIQDNDTIIPDIFISEIVDPSDNAGSGRYVELYNPGSEAVDLAAGQWNLIIYFNANPSGTDIPLTGTIAPGGTYIVAQDATFGTVYSTDPAEVQDGNLNSNGDDNFELRFGGGQSAGVLVDVYGQPGIQGTDEPWNFEDSRAVRLNTVTSGATTWDAAEWAILPTTVAEATPRVHPETIVLAPTGATATATGPESIELAFTPVDDNDVLIVFNTTGGNFTAPEGAAPAAGEPFAGGTVLSVGQVSPQTHSGLAPETTYFYGFFSASGTDYSNGVTADATTDVAPIEGLINSEDFTTPEWFNQTVTGDDPWDLSSQDALIDGATTLEGLAENHYLVSPPLDFSSVDGASMSFDYAGAFDVPDVTTLTLLYSTNYPGSGDPEAAGVTWSEITFDFSNISSDSTLSLVNSGSITLPEAIIGLSNVHLAFQYQADGTLSGSEQWVIDDIIVQGLGSTPLDDYLASRSLIRDDLATDINGNGFTVIEEYLAGFGDGLGDDSILFGIDADAPAVTLTSDLETDPDGIVIELLATSDLSAGFTSVPFTVSSVDNLDGTYTRSYIETTPPAEADSRFYQLRLTVE
ncbi:MAG: hypothetical protein GVY36_00545 [Verrucomicrobia bacterium]|jgi:hypothetical protein|nr:hypothetical protein [Verrucomicrobiota bacterium]